MNSKTWFKISCFSKVFKAWWYTEKHTDEFSCIVLKGKWEHAADGCVQLYMTNVNKLTHFLGLPLGLFSPVVSAFCKCQQPWISGRYFIKCFKQIFQAHNLSQAESFSYTATKGEGYMLHARAPFPLMLLMQKQFVRYIRASNNEPSPLLKFLVCAA